MNSPLTETMEELVIDKRVNGWIELVESEIVSILGISKENIPSNTKYFLSNNETQICIIDQSGETIIDKSQMKETPTQQP